jgi:hypothetical protein
MRNLGLNVLIGGFDIRDPVGTGNRDSAGRMPPPSSTQCRPATTGGLSW